MKSERKALITWIRFHTPQLNQILLVKEGDYYYTYERDATALADAYDLVMTRENKLTCCAFVYTVLSEVMIALLRTGCTVNVLDASDPVSLED